MGALGVQCAVCVDVVYRDLLDDGLTLIEEGNVNSGAIEVTVGWNSVLARIWTAIGRITTNSVHGVCSIGDGREAAAV